MPKNCCKKYWILFATLFFSLAYAQKAPALLVNDSENGRSFRLGLHELSIEIKVTGNLAVTTLEMVFYNDFDRELNGQIYFPLSKGQQVSRFATDISGKLREAVMVEKRKGRQAFESAARYHLDPALLELTKGNYFKARIYQIPAKGYKKVVIAFEETLPAGQNSYRYERLLSFKEKVERFYLRAEVTGHALQPVWDRKNEIIVQPFAASQNTFLAEAEHWYYLPNQNIVFHIPRIQDRPNILIENNGRERWFYATLTPPVLREKRWEFPGKICLLWDASQSGATQDTAKIFSVLNTYFQEIRDCKIDLVPFANIRFPAEKFTIREGNWQKLRQRFAQINYDGGTQLGALDLSRLQYDEFLLITDGISNFGKHEIKSGKSPVQVINSWPGAAHDYLTYIAEKSGGIYLNLSQSGIKETGELLLEKQYRFLFAEYNNERISALYPSHSRPVNNDFTIAGKLLKKRARLVLNFGFPGEARHQETLYLEPDAQIPESGIVQRLWAKQKISELNQHFHRNKAEITRLGKHYDIITRNTSLLMLEDAMDYVAHRIVPPRDLQKEYYRLLKSEKEAIAQNRTMHLENVVTMFEARKSWWQQRFSWQNLAEPADTTARDTAFDEIESEFILPAQASGDSIPFSWNNVENYSTNALSGEIIPEKRPPDAAYLKRLAAVDSSQWLTVYFEEKKAYKNSFTFFLDIAGFFQDKKQPGIALRILSNIAEMALEDHRLLRILGHRLSQFEHHKLAADVFREVLEMQEKEPQSYRDLAMVYQELGKYQQAVDLLYHVATHPWGNRFPEIELIALTEMNAIIARQKDKVKTGKIDDRLLQNMPVDLRIVLNWDSDNVDMDLWITDPTGEKCFFQHPKTRIGGLLSKDFSAGYGPEAFVLRRALPGDYQVQIYHYGNQQQVLAGAMTAQALIFTGFGSPFQEKQKIVLHPGNTEGVIDVGRFYCTAANSLPIGKHFEIDSLQFDNLRHSKSLASYQPNYGKLTGPLAIVFFLLLLLLLPGGRSFLRRK